MASGAALIGLQVASALAGGLSERSQARSEARALDQNARLTELDGENDVLAALRQSRMEEGAAIADSGASGQTIGSGSVADIIYANAVARQQEALNIRASAASEAAGLRGQAKATRKRGDAALIGGVFRAGAAALSGIHSQKQYERVRSAVAAGRAAELQQPQKLGSIPVPRVGSVPVPVISPGQYPSPYGRRSAGIGGL